MMNKCILLGRLCKDPELRKTSQDISVCKFTIAVNRKGEGADFIDCTSFRGTADTIQKYFTKGKPILIEGRLQIDSYEVEGQKRTKANVIVDSFDFVGDTKKEEAKETQSSSLKMEDVELNEFDYPF